MKLFEMRHEIITEELKVITTEKATNSGLFGPLYHGSSAENLASIRKDGFKIVKGEKGDVGISHGYPDEEYGHTGFPPPIHHLGFGVYFTTVKSIGKKFNNNSVRGLVKFYIDAPNLETINFGSPNTMMKWWVANGYNISDRVSRYDATENLTRELSSKYNAVWFKGKGLRTLLDGDQVCVYDTSKIFMVDDKHVTGYALGAIVKHNGAVPSRFIGRESSYAMPPDGAKGTIVAKTPIPYDRFDDIMLAKLKIDPEKDKNWITVKWNRGGEHSNYTEGDLVPEK